MMTEQDRGEQLQKPPERRSPYIERVIIRNFRGISEVEVELEPEITILAGRNNSGKSRIIAAIQLVLGGRNAESDDFTMMRLSLSVTSSVRSTRQSRLSSKNQRWTKLRGEQS
jgi:predicted ATP-dependent endonuclease of OLD family